MSIITKSPQARKERLNVESMLSFDGVDQWADGGKNFNIETATNHSRDWAISFFIILEGGNQYILGTVEETTQNNWKGIQLTNDPSNDRFIISIGDRSSGPSSHRIHADAPPIPTNRLVHVVTQYDSNVQEVIVYYNGIFQNVTYLLNNPPTIDYYYDENQRLGIAKKNSEIYGNIVMSHLTFFNRTLTDPEIRSIHRNGGILPPNTHVNCVAHYPMTQREGEWLYDQVEQYNYIKSPNYNRDPDLQGTGWTTLGTWVVEDNKLKHKGDQGGTFTQQAQQDGALSGNTDYECHIVIEELTHNLRVLFGTSGTSTGIVINSTGRHVVSGNSGASSNFWLRLEPTSATGAIATITYLAVYEKGKASLRANHALLKNFDDIEHSGAAQNAWKGFYDKQNLRPLIGDVKLNAIDNYIHFGDYQGALATYMSDIRNTSNELTIEFMCNIRDASKNFYFFSKRLSSSKGLYASHNSNGNTGIAFVNNSFSNGWFMSMQNRSARTGIFHAIYTLSGTDQSKCNIYCRDQHTLNFTDNMVGLSDTSAPGENLRVGSWRTQTQSSFFPEAPIDPYIFRIYDRLVTSDEANHMLNTLDVPPSLSSNLELNTEFLSNEVGEIVNYNGANGNIVGASIDLSKTFEKKSFLPPIKKGLRFDGADDYLKFPASSLTNEKGYTIFFTFQLPTERNFANNPYPDRFVNFRKDENDQVYFLIRGKPQKRIGIIYSNSTGGNIQSIDSSSIKEVSKPNFICLTLSDEEIKIFHNGRLINTQPVSFIPDLSSNYGTNLFYPADGFDLGDENFRNLDCLSTNLGIAKGIATPKQVIEMWNNGLLANPKKSWSNLDWQLYLDFNQIIDNNGTYEIANNGSAGGNAVLSGYAASDLQDQLTSKIRVLENTRLDKLYPSFYPKIYPQKS